MAHDWIDTMLVALALLMVAVTLAVGSRRDRPSEASDGRSSGSQSPGRPPGAFCAERLRLRSALEE